MYSCVRVSVRASVREGMSRCNDILYLDVGVHATVRACICVFVSACAAA